MKIESNKEQHIISTFVKKEKKQLIDFFSNFNVIGLAIASVIGLASSSLSKTFTEQIIMPFVEPYFSDNWKNYTIQIGYSTLGVGLLLSDIIYLIIVVFTMFIIYSLFKNYLSNIIDKKNSKNKKLYNYQIKMINELSEIKNELKKHNKKKQNEV
jgi:large-conductance mechanosensitive channel